MEKYLKEVLNEAGIGFSKTHDLNLLLALAIQVVPPWAGFSRSMARLTSYAVGFRYPGLSANASDAATSFQICRSFRIAAREQLLGQ